MWSSSLFRPGSATRLSCRCAELSRTIEFVDYALHPGTEPQCYCGNSAKQRVFRLHPTRLSAIERTRLPLLPVVSALRSQRRAESWASSSAAS